MFWAGGSYSLLPANAKLISIKYHFHAPRRAMVVSFALCVSNRATDRTASEALRFLIYFASLLFANAKFISIGYHFHDRGVPWSRFMR